MDPNAPKIINTGDQTLMAIQNRIHQVVGMNENGQYVLGQQIGRIEGNRISLNNGDEYQMYTLGNQSVIQKIDPRQQVESRYTNIEEGEWSSDDMMDSSDEERQRYVNERKEEQERQKRFQEKVKEINAKKEQRRQQREARKQQKNAPKIVEDEVQDNTESNLENSNLEKEILDTKSTSNMGTKSISNMEEDAEMLNEFGF